MHFIMYYVFYTKQDINRFHYLVAS